MKGFKSLFDKEQEDLFFRHETYVKSVKKLSRIAKKEYKKVWCIVSPEQNIYACHVVLFRNVVALYSTKEGATDALRSNANYSKGFVVLEADKDLDFGAEPWAYIDKPKPTGCI